MVREGLEGPLYFNYSLIEKEGRPIRPARLLRGPDGRVPDRRAGRQGRRLHRHGDRGRDAVHDERLVQRAARAIRPGAAAPVHPLERRCAKLQAFDEKDLSDKPMWLRKQARKRLGKALKQTIANERRRRLEQLLSVDEAVRDIVSELSQEGLVDDTYIIFASDNGFFRGEHRIAGGKYLAYEPSSRVPLMIRSPGITAGVQSDELVSAIDIPQTIEEITTGTTDPNADGRSFLPYAQNPTLRSTRPLLLEADTGPGQGNARFDPRRERLGGQGRQGQGRRPRRRQEPRPGEDGHQDGRQRQLRPGLPGRSHLRYLYVLYANGQSELYDLLLDPAEPAQARRPALPLRPQVPVRPTRRLTTCRRRAAASSPAPTRRRCRRRRNGSGNRTKAPAAPAEGPRLGFSAEGHWPNWLRHRPPKSAIPGSSPGCPAPRDDTFRTTERRADHPPGDR